MRARLHGSRSGRSAATAAAVGVLAALVSAAVLVSGAHAQQGPGGLGNPQRDCQSVVACRFTKGGSYRGCISAYSCRVCRLVTARCSVGTASRKCQRMQCGWGA